MGAKGILIVSAKVINLSDKETYEISLPLALIGKGSKDILLVMTAIRCAIVVKPNPEFFVLGSRSKGPSIYLCTR